MFFNLMTKNSFTGMSCGVTFENSSEIVHRRKSFASRRIGGFSHGRPCSAASREGKRKARIMNSYNSTRRGAARRDAVCE